MRKLDLVRTIGWIFAGSMLCTTAHGLDLIGAWHAAEANDLEYASARASHQAGEAKRAQGSALWRPSIDLVGVAGRMSNTTSTQGAQFSAPGLGQQQDVNFNTSIHDGNSTSWGLAARQTLISGSRMAQSRELELASDLADIQWMAARQELMLRTAERYFDVALAEETSRVLHEQQTALERSLSEAQEKFRQGDSPITDTHEAEARALTVKAQALAAETDLQIKQFALADLTGIAAKELYVPVPSETQATTGLAPLDQWMNEATQHNPGLRMQAVSLDIARQDAAKSRLISSPSLDLVAKVGRDHLSGSGDFGPASNTANSAMIGIQVTIPVFTGGYRSAQHQEALSLAEKARLDEARTRQQVSLQTRSAWLGITTGLNRVKALEAANLSSRARLDSTRLGQEVGDRSTIDLLNAQAESANAELALLQARISVYTERLRLAALAGALDEDQLRAISSELTSHGSSNAQ